MVGQHCFCLVDGSRYGVDTQHACRSHLLLVGETCQQNLLKYKLHYTLCSKIMFG